MEREIMKPNYRKIVQMMNFFADKSSEHSISKICVLKLVFLADRFHMRKYGSMISNDTYWAMSYGPVASCTKNIAEQKFKNIPDASSLYAQKYLSAPERDVVHSLLPPDMDELGSTEVEALEKAFSIFMRVSDVVDFTHKLPEWKKHKHQLTNIHSRCQMNLLDFFDTPRIDDYSGLTTEHVRLAKEIFQEESKIDRLLQ